MGASGRTEEALSLAKTGDQAAFADLVRIHQSMVFSLAHHFLRDRALAEELAQEVFLHLYRHLAAIESPEHLRHWLRRVTSHRCIDFARQQKTQPSAFLSGDWPEPAADDHHPDPLVAGTLRRLVAALPARPRMIVTLRYQEDLDPVEIAELLEMPVNTVKSHLRRSLAILRQKMIRHLGEEVEV